MKPYVLAAFAAFSLVSLSACGGNMAVAPGSVPPMARLAPMTSKAIVTAIYNRQPIPNIVIALWKAAPPTCPLCWPRYITKLASGKTGPKGRVILSGNWTNTTFVCADGDYHGSHASVCQRPFPSAVTIDFK